MNIEEAFNTIDTKTRCGMGIILKELTPDELRIVEAALSSSHMSHQSIANALQKSGYKVSAKTVERHRNRNTGKGQCSCP